MIGDTEELKTKVSPITIGIIIVSVIVGYYIGFAHSELKSLSNLLEVRYQMAIEEIQGLRADVYREDAHLQKQIEELKK